MRSAGSRGRARDGLARDWRLAVKIAPRELENRKPLSFQAGAP